jgi:5-methylcytosine-specific restriction endonuclease McrA
MDVDHIIPEAAGGPIEEGNLWLFCSKCNDHKSKKTHATDPQTGETVPLFNPQQQNWKEHFEWSETGDTISGKTAIGRATVEALQLNRSAQDGTVVKTVRV